MPIFEIGFDFIPSSLKNDPETLAQVQKVNSSVKEYEFVIHFFPEESITLQSIKSEKRKFKAQEISWVNYEEIQKDETEEKKSILTKDPKLPRIYRFALEKGNYSSLLVPIQNGQTMFEFSHHKTGNPYFRKKLFRSNPVFDECSSYILTLSWFNQLPFTKEKKIARFHRKKETKKCTLNEEVTLYNNNIFSFMITTFCNNLGNWKKLSPNEEIFKGPVIANYNPRLRKFLGYNIWVQTKEEKSKFSDNIKRFYLGFKVRADTCNMKKSPQSNGKVQNKVQFTNQALNKKTEQLYAIGSSKH